MLAALSNGRAETPVLGSIGADTLRRTSVRLTATLTSIGDPEPTCAFRWWPAGGETSTVEATRSGTFFWATVTNLTAGQTYHFHAWAGNNEGEAISTNGEWTTVSATPRQMIWTGPSNGSWFVEANWTPNGMPDDGLDEVVLNSGTLLLTNVTPPVASFTQGGGILIFSNWHACLLATNVTITGGVVTLPPAFLNTDMSNRIRIVCDSFRLETPGAINGDARGYRGGDKAGIATGQGPGGGYAGANAGAGGGHGGIGGGGYNGGSGAANGTATRHNPGSGGGASTGYTSQGGHGGGCIEIEVADVATISGLISANGQDAPHNRGGGGAGGGIRIECRTITGSNGTIRANGGYAPGSGGGGGGGRIAILFDPISQAFLPRPTLTLSARCGLAAQYGRGELGTVYLSSFDLIASDVFPHSGRVLLPEMTNWTVSSLLFSNGWVRFSTNNFGTLVVSNALVIIGTNAIVESWFTNIQCGRLELTNGAQLYVYASPTNVMAGSPFFGATVRVDSDIVLGPQSRLVPVSFTTNGGSVAFTGNHLVVSSNAAISASGVGFLRGINSAGYTVHGHGPGRGWATGNNGSGAGHGGRGGRSAGSATRGQSYGDPLRPLLAGSGGAGRTGYSGAAGGNGGGLIYFELSGRAELSGQLAADGDPGVNHGGGAGGSIFIRCVQCTSGPGTGLSARGGNGYSTTDGAGGGGRIAVWYGRPSWIPEPDPSELLISETPPPSYLGTLSVAPGTISYTTDAEPGTIRFVTVRKPSGTVISIR